MCPFDRAMVQAMKYLSLFLPTTSSIPAEKGWKLWFDEFMTLWSSFTNSPSWETGKNPDFSRQIKVAISQISARQLCFDGKF